MYLDILYYLFFFFFFLLNMAILHTLFHMILTIVLCAYRVYPHIINVATENYQLGNLEPMFELLQRGEYRLEIRLYPEVLCYVRVQNQDQRVGTSLVVL